MFLCFKAEVFKLRAQSKNSEKNNVCIYIYILIVLRKRKSCMTLYCGDLN